MIARLSEETALFMLFAKKIQNINKDKGKVTNSHELTNESTQIANSRIREDSLRIRDHS